MQRAGLRVRPGLRVRATDGRGRSARELGRPGRPRRRLRPRRRPSGPRRRSRPRSAPPRVASRPRSRRSPRRPADPPAPERWRAEVARSDWARPDWVRPDPRDLSSAYPSLTTGAWRTRAPSASSRTRTSARFAREIAAVEPVSGSDDDPPRARAVGQPHGAYERPVHARGADPFRRPHDLEVGGAPRGVGEPDPGTAAQTEAIRGVPRDCVADRHESMDPVRRHRREDRRPCRPRSRRHPPPGFGPSRLRTASASATARSIPARSRRSPGVIVSRRAALETLGVAGIGRDRVAGQQGGVDGEPAGRPGAAEDRDSHRRVASSGASGAPPPGPARPPARRGGSPRSTSR